MQSSRVVGPTVRWRAEVLQGVCSWHEFWGYWVHRTRCFESGVCTWETVRLASGPGPARVVPKRRVGAN